MNVRYQSESIHIKMKFLTYYEQNAIYFSVVTSMDIIIPIHEHINSARSLLSIK